MNEPEPQLISAKTAFFEVYKADFAEIPQNRGAILGFRCIFFDFSILGAVFSILSRIIETVFVFTTVTIL